MASDAQNRRPLAVFDAALAKLDRELVGLGQSIQVKAVGGYALLKHGVREGPDALTVDIDTVTRPYPRPVVDAIHRVAEDEGLERDWLNGYMVFDDPRDVEDMLQARWLPQDTGLANIELSIADLPTLTRSKIMAAADAELSGRPHDTDDLLALAKAQGLPNIKAFTAAYPDPYGENAPAYDALREAYRTDNRRRFPWIARDEAEPGSGLSAGGRPAPTEPAL